MSGVLDNVEVCTQLYAACVDTLIGDCSVIQGPATLFKVTREGGLIPATPIKKSGRVALVAHGFDATRCYVLALAQFLVRYQEPCSECPYYDAVYIYEYDSVTGTIEQAAINLARLIDINLKPGKFDLFGHSAGGLVFRYLVKILGFKASKLVLIGTPNAGIPAQIVNFVRIFEPQLALSPILTELTEGSDFFATLNSGQSAFRCSIKYYTIVGTTFLGYRPFVSPVLTPLGLVNSVGQFIQLAYNALRPGTVTDGLIPDYLVENAVLVDESAFWAQNACSRFRVPFNHRELVGVLFDVAALYEPRPFPYFLALPIELVNVYTKIVADNKDC